MLATHALDATPLDTSTGADPDAVAAARAAYSAVVAAFMPDAGWAVRTGRHDWERVTALAFDRDPEPEPDRARLRAATTALARVSTAALIPARDRLAGHYERIRHIGESPDIFHVAIALRLGAVLDVLAWILDAREHQHESDDLAPAGDDADRMPADAVTDRDRVDALPPGMPAALGDAGDLIAAPGAPGEPAGSGARL